MEGPEGEFYVREPDGRRLHVNRPGQPLIDIPCHCHRTDHGRALWANDTPGPDGRLGWLEEIWWPGMDIKGPPRTSKVIRGNGPDSFNNIPKLWYHKFTLLSAQGYHKCIHFHWEEDENGLRRVPYYTGHLDPTG